MISRIVSSRVIRRICYILIAITLMYPTAYVVLRLNLFPGFHAESSDNRVFIRCYPYSEFSTHVAKWPIPLMKLEGHLTQKRMDYLRNYRMIQVYEPDSQH